MWPRIFKSWAICGCGRDGCIEAHISGSGVFGKTGIKAEDLPLDQWPPIIRDAIEAHILLLNRLKKRGFEPKTLRLFGSMALGRPGLMLPGIRDGLRERRDEIELSFVPEVKETTYRDDSPLVGAKVAASELAKNLG